MNIQEIKQKFEKLKKQDRGLRRFAASKHQYKSQPVSEEEIERFEDKFGISLPFTYKRFLTEIGYGTGPYFGIWSLKESEEELEIEIKDVKEEKNIVISPSKPFPFTEKDIEDLIQRIAKGEKSEYASTPLLEATFP